MTCNIRYGTVLPRAIHNLASNPLVLRSRKARSVHFQGRNNGLWTHGLHTGRKLFSGTSIINTQTFKKSEKLSIQQLKEHFLLLQLARTIACEDASVCCGGKIKIENCGAETNSRVENPSKDSDQTIKHRDSLDESVVPTEGYDRLTSPPVVLRWDSSSTRNGRKIILPTVDAQRISDTRAIEDLIKDGAPATFGKGAVEVLDESYRKAIKLDPDQFSTTFHPNDFGITDDIHQTLQTAIAGSGKDCNVATDLLGVRAELYKLNVSKYNNIGAATVQFRWLTQTVTDILRTIGQISSPRRHTSCHKSNRLISRLSPLSSRGGPAACDTSRKRYHLGLEPAFSQYHTMGRLLQRLRARSHACH